MGSFKIGALTLMAAGAGLLLCGCGSIDETILDTRANTSVEINMPYATATPLPANMSAPQAIVIDADGNVTLNDTSVIEGDFQSLRAQEQQTEYRSLSLGNTGIAVQALQLRLKDLGYFNGDVSGLFDSDTEAAVKRFEQTFGTMQTGVATPKLQLKLFASTAPAFGTEAYNNAVLAQYSILRPGTVGSSVYALQQRLKNLDYPISELTGVFDDQTANAVPCSRSSIRRPRSTITPTYSCWSRPRRERCPWSPSSPSPRTATTPTSPAPSPWATPAPGSPRSSSA